MPNTLIRIGVISEPAPMPVSPTRRPTASPAAIIPVLMSMWQNPPFRSNLPKSDKCKRFCGECKPYCGFLPRSGEAQSHPTNGDAPAPSERGEPPAGERGDASRYRRLLLAVGLDQHLRHLRPRELDRRHLAFSEHVPHLGSGEEHM